jgi:AraC-like DNA-binding protein
MKSDWIELRQHADTGIETIKAHFEGHAYDPHWHDSYLVGITLSGTQQFHCRRNRHHSRPGDAFLLEPGEIHDGDAPVEGGFTYLTFYLDERWLTSALQGLFEFTPDSYSLHFEQTLTCEPQLVRVIGDTFATLHNNELRIVQQTHMDNLLSQITHHSCWRKKAPSQVRSAPIAQRARDYLYAHIGDNIGLSDLAREVGTDRFTLTRCFKREFHLAPHAWFIQMRLTKARRSLAKGMSPADVAMELGFADQSHLGRWFRRAYQLSPARYQRLCTNLPDIPGN